MAFCFMFEGSLSNCTFCPHECGLDRNNVKKGVCNSGTGYSIASICVHRGEEPAISGKNGICNVFFTRCNLKCIYCQNHQISRQHDRIIEYKLTLEQVVEKIIKILDSGINSVGFVSPSHFIPQMINIIEALHAAGKHPITVYNTNAYDKVETLRSLEGMIDIYLPDFKYMDSQIAKEYSGVKNYPDIAKKSVREMFRQKGSNVFLNDDGQAESGMIIRHLVLPGHMENSLNVIRFIAEELSPSIHLSLMSQYYPTEAVKGHPNLGRQLNQEEYAIVLNELDKLGFYRGWTQELESKDNYRPDFTEEHPFE